MLLSDTTDKSNISVVFFGDSITEGQYVEHNFRWTDLVTKRLINTFPDLNIIAKNKGISGETSRQGILRFAKDVQEIAPDILTIQFGLNDGNHWETDRGLTRVSKKSFRANLEEMIERARCFDVEHIILSNNHRTLKTNLLAGNVTLEHERYIFNEIIKEVALATEVKFCDIDQWFNKINSSYENYLLPPPDVLHLSQIGHEYYAEKMFSYILPVVNQLSSCLLSESV